MLADRPPSVLKSQPSCPIKGSSDLIHTLLGDPGHESVDGFTPLHPDVAGAVAPAGLQAQRVAAVWGVERKSYSLEPHVARSSCVPLPQRIRLPTRRKTRVARSPLQRERHLGSVTGGLRATWGLSPQASRHRARAQPTQTKSMSGLPPPNSGSNLASEFDEKSDLRLRNEGGRARCRQPRTALWAEANAPAQLRLAARFLRRLKRTDSVFL
jgi:hypothetical protein